MTVAVSDYADGMDPKILEHIFAQPFYAVAVPADGTPTEGCIRIPCPSFMDIEIIHEEEAPATEAAGAECTCLHVDQVSCDADDDTASEAENPPPSTVDASRNQTE